MSETADEKMLRDPIKAERDVYFQDYTVQIQDLQPEQLIDLMRAEHKLLEGYQVSVSIPGIVYGAMKREKGAYGAMYHFAQDLEFLKITPDNCYEVLMILQKNLMSLPREQLEELRRIIGRGAIQTRQLFETKHLHAEEKNPFSRLPHDLQEAPHKAPVNSPVTVKNTSQGSFRALLSRLTKK